ncbi:hypothetical protein FMJ36_17160 [Klebsiella michiganensis]|uniref:hypothetical protein n=1 Tax=Klebsiella michiganensis TaxID=1134687 RepID=UPI001CC90ABF|nr:hypothetical protein [Klebsiella michiganensis]MBZ7499725.1 hypothetical protein [Klebsiella michiganensis]
MGLAGIAKNVNAQSFSMGVNLPVMDGILGAWFGGSKGAWVNQISGGQQPTIVGTPTHLNEYSSQFSTTAYIDTNIAETASMTLLIVAKIYAPTSSRMQFLGNFSNSVTDGGSTVAVNGSGIVVEAAGTLEMVGASYSGVAGAASSGNAAILAAESGLKTSLAATDNTDWRAFMGKIDTAGAAGTAGNRYIKNLTKGMSATQALVAGNVRDLRNTATQRIGTRGPAGNANAATAIMMAMMWNRALTSAEETAMYSYVQSYAARRGISV